MNRFSALQRKECYGACDDAATPRVQKSAIHDRRFPFFLKLVYFCIFGYFKFLSQDPLKQNCKISFM